jgi:hypothetical protein
MPVKQLRTFFMHLGLPTNGRINKFGRKFEHMGLAWRRRSIRILR